jgi:manganese efflux pump family protein
MLPLLTLAVLVGLDNLQVSAALGLMAFPPGRRLRLAVAFGLCEGLMPLAGLALGHGLLRALGPWPERVEAAVLLACGAAILLFALRERRPETNAAGTSAAGRRWLLYGLPLSLSLDNLLAGVALGATGSPLVLSALVIGAVSTALCLAGLFGAARLARRLPGEAGAWSGAFLVLLGLVRAWGGGA